MAADAAFVATPTMDRVTMKPVAGSLQELLQSTILKDKQLPSVSTSQLTMADILNLECVQTTILQDRQQVRVLLIIGFWNQWYYSANSIQQAL